MTHSAPQRLQNHSKILAFSAAVALALALFATVSALNAEATDISVEGLTGPEVVQKLDLKPISLPASSDCNLMAGPGGNTAYCLDDLQVDDVTLQHIAAQVMGFEDNEVLDAYAAKRAEVDQLQERVSDSADPELLAVQNEVVELLSQMTLTKDLAGK